MTSIHQRIKHLTPYAPRHTTRAVTRYKMARTVLSRNCIMSLLTRDGLLIDTGFAYLAEQFYRALQEKNVEQIANTHHHEDHVGANYLFEQRRSVPAFAHPLALPLIERPPAKLKLYRDVVWGVPQPAHVQAVGTNISTAKYSFQVLHLPGHSHDHIGLYEPKQGWLFSGDLFLSVKVRVLRLDEDIYASMASLRRAIALPLQRLFCGSAKVLDNPGEILQQKLAFYEETQQRIASLHQKGWEAEEIRDAVLGKEGVWPWMSQGEFSKLNLVKAFLKRTE
jgi:glyoxylase-like metal-dependent hydrolase (beta-lactamase superfamily II)